MSSYLKYSLIKYLKGRGKSHSSAFTLVELIVVVVIIGILSSIAIPSFQNASDKAKQKEASTLLASYTKAAQAYFTEYGQSPANTADLGQYISITACKGNDPKACKADAPQNLTTATVAAWKSPSGLFDIVMAPSGDYLYFTAVPAGKYATSGFGVSSCFNSKTGATKLTEMTEKGPDKVKKNPC